MLKVNFICLVLTAFLSTNLLVAGNSDWGYPNLDADEQFPKWGGLCDNGAKQSPIDLNRHGAFKSDFSKLVFENFDKKQSSIAMVNNGHSIQLSNFSKSMNLKGGPLSTDYVVEQLHFHWWSEHTINNTRFPLECHIVHRNTHYADMAEAGKYPDGLAVVAVLYHFSKTENEAIDDILEYIDEVKDHEDINKPVIVKEFKVSELMPDVDGYFTYSGSLTTPTCAETVTWLVLHETFPVTSEQVDKFKAIEYDEGKLLLNNYRAIQKIRNRPIVSVMYDDNDDNDDRDGKGDGASSVHVSLGAMLIMTLVRLFY